MQSAHGHMSNLSHGAWLPMVLQISFDNINDSLPASLSPLQHCHPAPSLSHSETMQMKHGSRSTCNISYYSIYTMKKWIKLTHIKPCIHVRKDIHGEITHLPNVTEVPGMPPCLNGHLHPHTGSPKSSCVNANGCMSKYHTLPCQHTWPLPNGTHVACVKSCSGTAGMQHECVYKYHILLCQHIWHFTNNIIGKEKTSQAWQRHIISWASWLVQLMRSHSLYIHSIGSALAPTSHCSCACIHHDLCGTA